MKILYLDIETRNVNFKDPGFHKAAFMLCAVMKSDIHPFLETTSELRESGWWKLVVSMEWADRIVGHNILGFDLPIIRQQLLGFYAAEEFDAKFLPKAYDTCGLLYEKHGKRYSLANLAKWNGLGEKTLQDENRSMGELWDAGEYSKVLMHCAHDVKLVEGVYRLMQEDKLILEY